MYSCPLLPIVLGSLYISLDIQCLQVWFSIIWTHLIILFWNWSPCECLVVALAHILSNLWLCFLKLCFQFVELSKPPHKSPILTCSYFWFWPLGFSCVNIRLHVHDEMLLCESQTQKYNKKTGVKKNDPSDPFCKYQGPCFSLGLFKGQIIWGQKLESLPSLWPPWLHNGQRQTPKKNYPEGERGGIIKGLTFYLLSSHFVCVCDYSERGEDKRRGPQWWRDLKRWDHFKWDFTFTHTLSLSSTLLNLPSAE